MPAAETILKTAFELLRNSGDVQVSVDSRGLGMAYAIPSGSEQSVVDDYGPWADAEVKQVFFRQSAIGAVMADIQLTMSWRRSSGKQYIIEANLDKSVNTIDPSVNIGISVRFGQPDRYDRELDAFYIPFLVEVKFQPTFDTQTFLSKGQIRADGSGSFPVFPG